MVIAPQPCRSPWRACKRRASRISRSSSSAMASMTRCAPPSRVCRQPTPASDSSIFRKAPATVKSIAMACFVRRAGGSSATRPTTTCGCRAFGRHGGRAGECGFRRRHACQRRARRPRSRLFFRHRAARVQRPVGELASPPLRAVGWPVSLHFPAPDRRNWTERQRVDELVRWMEIIARPDGREHIYRAMLRTFGDILLEHGLVVTQEALEREQTLRAKAEAERDAEQMVRTKAQAERDLEQALRALAEAERDAMRESTFWRLTGPLRATINLFKRL